MSYSKIIFWDASWGYLSPTSKGESTTQLLEKTSRGDPAYGAKEHTGEAESESERLKRLRKKEGKTRFGARQRKNKKSKSASNSSMLVHPIRTLERSGERILSGKCYASGRHALQPEYLAWTTDRTYRDIQYTIGRKCGSAGSSVLNDFADFS